MKSYFFTIFALVLLLGPLSAGASQCCFSKGGTTWNPVSGTSIERDLCEIKKIENCRTNYTEVDCSSQDVCKNRVPVCCIYKPNDQNKKGHCFESADRSYDCVKTLLDGETYDKKDTYCADLSADECPSNLTDAPAAPTTPAPPPPEFKIITPNIPLNLPTVNLQEFIKVKKENGYIYIPFISVFLVGAYKMGVGIAAILAVIMIMAGGLIWIAAAGDSGKIGKAKTMISSAVVGLVLTFGSYLVLQLVNPDLVNFTALKIPAVGMEIIDISTAESDILETPVGGPITTPTWNKDTFNCSANNLPAGVADPASMVSLTCPVGIMGSGMASPDLKNALCKAGVAADSAGYQIRVSSSYRTFASQVSEWCGKGAIKYPNVNERKTYFAVPGFSVHGIGNAVDVVLIDKKTGKSLYSISSTGQCGVDLGDIMRIEQFMANAGFKRYENEIWHFEVNSTLSMRGTGYGMPPKCKKR